MAATAPQQKVIRSYLLISGLFRLSASLIWPINFLFLLSGGLSHFEAFSINAIFASFEAFFEIPTGVVADTLGRRKSVLLSVITLSIGTAIYAAAGYYQLGFGAFVVMTLFIALGFTFYSGAVDAWMVDALKSLDYTEPLDDIFGKVGQVTSWALVGGVLLGGALADIHLVVPFLVRLVLLLLLIPVVYFTVRDVGFSPRQLQRSELIGEMRHHAITSIRFGWQQPSVRLIMIAYLIMHVYFIWGWHGWQEWFLDLAVWTKSTKLNGTIAAVAGVVMVGGNIIIPWLRQVLDRRTTLLLIIVVTFGGTTIALGIANAFWITVPLYLVSMFIWAIYGTVVQAYLHDLTPTAQRATVISFAALMASLGSVIGHTGLGYLTEVWPYNRIYILGGSVVLFAIPFVLALRKRGDKEDAYPKPATTGPETV